MEVKQVNEQIANDSFLKQLKNFQSLGEMNSHLIENEEVASFFNQLVELLMIEQDSFDVDEVDLELENQSTLMLAIDELKEHSFHIEEMKTEELEEIFEQIIGFFYQVSTLDAEQVEQLNIKNIAKMIQIAQQLSNIVQTKDIERFFDQTKQLETIVKDTMNYFELLSKEPKTNHLLFNSKQNIQMNNSPFVKIVNHVEEPYITQNKNNADVTIISSNQQSQTNTFETQSTLSKLEQFTLYFNESKGESTKKLQQQFERILARAQFADGLGMSKLSLRLSPAHLGNIKIELIQKDGVLIANLLATTSKAKQLMESQLHLLRQSFINQNINVERVEVNIPQADQENSYTKDEQQANSGQAEEDSNQADQHEAESSNTFSDELNELLFETEA